MKEFSTNSKDRTEKILMYGDRVRFDWVDDTIDKEIELEGLYAGPCIDNPRLSVVTVVAPKHYRGEVLYPRTEDLMWIEHELAKPLETKEQAKVDPLYDRTSLIEMRDNILDNFDFEKVHKAMVVLDWVWGSLGEDERVPEVSELKREARILLTDVIDKHIETGDKWVGISTGGFDTELLVCDDGLPDLSLRFYVDEWTEGGETWDEYRDSFERRRNGIAAAKVSNGYMTNSRKSRFFNND